MPSHFLHQLLARRDTWRGRASLAGEYAGQPTGFDALDQLLSHGGWPRCGLVELLCTLPCPPLIHLLLPILARAGGARMIVNPPARPCAVALARAGVPLEHLLVLQSGDRNTLLRACFEAAASDAVGVLAVWAPGGTLPIGTLRRLHLAAQQGRCLLMLMRPQRGAHQPSPAPLRLILNCAAPGELAVTVHKQPGGRPGDGCRLRLLPDHLCQMPPACAALPALTRRPLAKAPGLPLLLPRPVPLAEQRP